jgi:type II secretory ATPase GspE/PulE/Tfp pilus assembly ATPase PilB-like protein
MLVAMIDHAAETGHLVMSAAHTLDATETVTRIISAFPEHPRAQARLILASIVRGVISQHSRRNERSYPRSRAARNSSTVNPASRISFRSVPGASSRWSGIESDTMLPGLVSTMWLPV